MSTKINLTTFVNLTSDSARRDLTINAITQHPITGEIIDPFNGQQDIKDGIIRCVNVTAFKEDPLRVLRAARFAARYSHMTVDPVTLEAMKATVASGSLNELPAERFVAELQKVYKDAAHPNNSDGVLLFWRLIDSIGMFKHVRFFSGLGKEVVDAASVVHQAHCSGLFDMYGINNHESLFNVTMALYASFTMRKTHSDIVDRYLPMASSVGRFVYDFTVSIAGGGGSVVSIHGISDAVVKVLTKHRLQQIEDKKNVITHIDLALDALELASAGTVGKSQFVIAQMSELITAVKASEFEGLDGKDLGNAIFAKRVKVISDFIKST